ncbi:hypothetical protein AB0E55_28530 [Amycolatopsis keratiniphila]|uniref:hypothetical protein n=1 Tax=Amycolatopsis keratiniphila TaxID=129921 RepID=UPI0033FC63C0
MKRNSRRTGWMSTLISVIDGGSDRIDHQPCPRCDAHRLEVRYLGYPETRLATVYLWCNACLHGIEISRARAPEGMTLYPTKDPASAGGIPDFVRHQP